MKRFVKDIAWTAFANHFALLVGIPLFFVTPRFLSPEGFAVIAMVDLAMEYVKQYPLGTHFALERDLALLKAQGKDAAAESVRDAVWFFSVVAGIPVVLAPALWARFAKGAPQFVQLSYLVGCAGTYVFTLASVYQAVLKAERRFKADAVLAMAVALVPLAVLPLSLWLFGVTGYFVSNLVVACVAFAGYLRMFEKRPRLRLDTKAFGEILALGLPVFVIGLVETAYATVARSALLPIVTAAELGLFFFAWKTSRYFVTFPQAVGRVFMPNISAKLGATPDEKELAAHVIVPTLFMGQVMAFLMGGAALFLPELVRTLYPLYTGSTEALRIFSLAAFWPGIGVISWKYLLATKRWLPGLSAYVLAIATIWFGVRYGPRPMTVETAAWISAAAMMACNVVLLGLAFAAVSRNLVRAAGAIVLSCAPFVVLLAMTWGIRHEWSRWVEPRWSPHPLLAATIHGALYAVLFSPLLFAFWRRHGSWLRSSPASPAEAMTVLPPEAP